MPEFRVRVSHVIHEERTITVEAETPADAYDLALDRVIGGEVDWSKGGATADDPDAQVLDDDGEPVFW